ncbi:MAG TPA: FAD/NAD(P)-binding protein [Gammaproteobacteria bacterium]|jgi:uncharacterized NAD(P)/FAD-binding protein YdhS
MQRIAVIGAGFSGVATVIQLLRRHGSAPLTVTLISRHAELGRGVAYGTQSPSHLLNVPAARMSLFPDDEADFLRFAQGSDAGFAGGSFVPRRLYGEYLAARLEAAVASAQTTRFTALTVEATNLRLTPAEAVHIAFADGAALEVDQAVIASGNYPPRDPRLGDMSFYQQSRYVRDPWEKGALDVVDPSQPVLLIGSGLTMMDVALELDRRGLGTRLHALSRRGLLPLAHRPHGAGALEPGVIVDMLRKGRPSVRRWLKVLRLASAELAERDIDWRDVLGALRPVTAELWQNLDAAERRRFLRHLQPYWDVHRHRTAPEAHGALQRLLRDGRLTVEAGRLKSLRTPGQNAVQVTWRARHGDADAQLEVGTVINCTGPGGPMERSGDPLVLSLLRQGLMVPDALGLGVQVDAGGALLDRSGRASESLFYTGPLLKARDWECTAVPELRVAALKLADSLAMYAPEKAAQSSMA